MPLMSQRSLLYACSRFYCSFKGIDYFHLVYKCAENAEGLGVLVQVLLFLPFTFYPLSLVSTVRLPLAPSFQEIGHTLNALIEL
jgi:hypothetical protein